MASYKTKNHHYVSQFYLRNFSEDKSNINILFTENEKIMTNSIKTHCSKKNFYGTGEAVENVLSKIESVNADILNRIIKSSNFEKIEEKEKFHLKSWVFLQHSRDESSAKEVQNMGNFLFEKYKPIIETRMKEAGKEELIPFLDKVKLKCDKPVLESLKIAFTSNILAYDLEIILLVNRTKEEFITSDSPVVFYNPISYKLLNEIKSGFSSQGLVCFYPITPRLALFLFDKTCYEIDFLKENLLELKKESDIKIINSLQYILSNKLIIFKNIKNKDKHLKRYRELKLKRVKKEIEEKSLGKYNHPDGTTREIVKWGERRPTYNISKLTFLRFKEITSLSEVRNQELWGIAKKIEEACSKKQINSMGDIKKIFKENKKEI